MSHNPKVNDFVATVEAVNDGELTPEEMHETYANAQGYLDCDTLSRLEYFAERVREAIAIAHHDHPDNADGTRNPGEGGAHFDTPEEAGAYVTERLRQMKGGN